jgi:hypothetical protein
MFVYTYIVAFYYFMKRFITVFNGNEIIYLLNKLRKTIQFYRYNNKKYCVHNL